MTPEPVWIDPRAMADCCEWFEGQWAGRRSAPAPIPAVWDTELAESVGDRQAQCVPVVFGECDEPPTPAEQAAAAKYVTVHACYHRHNYAAWASICVGVVLALMGFAGKVRPQ